MILITGGAGFIGTRLAERLLERGETVKIFDDLSSGSITNLSKLTITGGAEFVKGDIRDAASVAAASGGCDLIYHLAAQSSVPISTEQPRLDLDVNVMGTFNVLEAARKGGCKVVFTSSSVVYGNAARIPTPEDAPLLPGSLYAASKMAAEGYCRVYSELFDVPAVILRLFNVYGPGTSKGVMIDLYRKLLRDSRKLELLGSGKQTKDYVYIDDTVEALLLAPHGARGAGTGVYNIGMGESYNVTELAGLMFELLGLGGVEVTIKGGESWPGDVEFTQADIGRAEREIGWKPKTGIREGVAMTLEGFIKKFGGVKRAGAQAAD